MKVKQDTSVQPLTHDERRLADRVLRRIHEQFRAFLSGLPPSARTASGLARLLSVDRTTCQRLVFIANRPYSGLDMVERLPGVRGLRQLVDAARRVDPSIKIDVVEPLEISIRRLQEALTALGGSQAVLFKRIAATPQDTGDDGDSPLLHRQQLFQSAAVLTGRHSETWVAIYAFQPSVTNGEVVGLEVARVHGLIGHHAKPDAVPLTFHNFSTEGMEEDGRFSSMDGGASGVLARFSTQPAPVISSKQPGEYLVQAIDTSMAETEQAIDLVLGTYNPVPYPLQRTSGVEEVWAMINFPVRKMVFDVYLHADLARACIPALATHLWRPDFGEQTGDRWQTRFSDSPRLELLGRGIGQAATPAYTRHDELTRFLFEQRGLEADRFVGFRCAVDYPIWRAGYCMSFDFSVGS